MSTGNALDPVYLDQGHDYQWASSDDKVGINPSKYKLNKHEK